MSCCIEPDLSLCRTGPCCPDINTPENEAIRLAATRIAASLIARLTGNQYTTNCDPITVRPCYAETCCDNGTLADLIYTDSRLGRGSNNLGVLSYTPSLVGGQVYNLNGCGVCADNCCTCCKPDCSITLPGQVCEVVSVEENGVTLDADQWYVLDNNTVGIKYRWVPSTDAGRHTSIIGQGFPTVTDPADRWEISVDPATVGPNTINYGNGEIGPNGTPNANISYVMPELPDASYTVQFFQNGDPTTYAFATAPFFSNNFTSYQYPEDVHPIGDVLVAGDVLVSNTNNNTTPPTRTRFTVQQGEFTRVSAQGFEISEDARYLIEFEEQEQSCFSCQDYNKQLGEDGTWGISYRAGKEVPEDINIAAGLYACELAKGLIGQACSLPEYAQAASRQGVDLIFINPLELIRDGLTGMPIVDRIIKAYNPHKLYAPARVWSTDMPTVRRETP